jgi:hypothetical protein
MDKVDLPWEPRMKDFLRLFSDYRPDDHKRIANNPCVVVSLKQWWLPANDMELEAPHHRVSCYVVSSLYDTLSLIDEETASGGYYYAWDVYNKKHSTNRGGPNNGTEPIIALIFLRKESMAGLVRIHNHAIDRALTRL